LNPEFVRGHGVFGKSQRDLSVKNPACDWWGSKKGGKRVKSYRKDVIAAHRVEFRMRRRFLEPHGINDLFDFSEFVDLLPGHHIHFARLDKQKLATRLQRTKNTTEVLSILKQVDALDGDLTAQLKLLRQGAGLNNVRRFLKPVGLNAVVLRALKKWAAQWPKAPKSLCRKMNETISSQGPYETHRRLRKLR
jgi:hypothetical protein